MVVPFLAGAEEFEGVDVADNVVDVLLVDEDLGVAALDKLLLQLVGRAVVGDGIDFRARHHAVADLEVGEVKGILEDLHLVIDLAPCGVLSMEDWTRSSRSTLVNVPSLLPSSILTPRRRRKRRESRVEKRLMGHRTI